MARDLESTIRGTLVIGIGILFITILATPLILHDGTISTPTNPRVLIDYIDDDNTTIILISSATGDHIYQNITLVLDGAVEKMNNTYTIEKQVPGRSFTLFILMSDNNDRYTYRLNMTFDPIDDKDSELYEISIENNDDLEMDLLEEDLPFRMIIRSVET